MNFDDLHILRYVEKSLDPETMKAFEKILEHDADLRHRVLEMRSSQLPYQAAFAAENLPPVPEELEMQIQQLSQVSRQGVSDTVVTGSFIKKWSMAACLCVVFLSGALLMLGFNSLKSPATEQQLTDDSFRPYGSKALIDAMIQYQALYTRKTVEMVHQNEREANQVISSFNTKGGHDLMIPDLSAQGYEFRRVQELAFEGEIIIQMVYLPETGKPLALCVTKANALQHASKSYRYAGINSVLWANRGMTYMLMGDQKEAELQNLLAAMPI